MVHITTILGVLILAFISFGFGLSQSSVKARPTDFDEVDAYINTKMNELGIPGAAVVVVEGNQIVHMQAFGVADADGRPVTPQTPFSTGSTGKSFTALGIMQLVEAGQIKLDASVQTYLPWFRVADVNASEIITVRQLLNQVSGIPQSIGQKQLANTDLSDSAIETNVQELATIELIAPPGERYEYSNSNYVVLGMIIQAVTGQSYEMYIREHIFKPLDMQNSFTSNTEAQQNGLAVGYQKWFGIPVASPNLPFKRGSLPAGYLGMSVEDFGHYLIAQLNEGHYQDVAALFPSHTLPSAVPATTCPSTTSSDTTASSLKPSSIAVQTTPSADCTRPSVTAISQPPPGKAQTAVTGPSTLPTRCRCQPFSVLRYTNDPNPTIARPSLTATCGSTAPAGWLNHTAHSPPSSRRHNCNKLFAADQTTANSIPPSATNPTNCPPANGTVTSTHTLSSPLALLPSLFALHSSLFATPSPPRCRPKQHHSPPPERSKVLHFPRPPARTAPHRPT